MRQRSAEVPAPRLYDAVVLRHAELAGLAGRRWCLLGPHMTVTRRGIIGLVQRALGSNDAKHASGYAARKAETNG